MECVLGDVMVMGELVTIFVSDEDIECGVNAPFIGAPRYYGSESWAYGRDLE